MPKQSQKDAALFIDANAYLHFYQTPQTRRLKDSLLAQQRHIFITEQIVNEVERNKLGVAQRFFNGLFTKEKQDLTIPELVFPAEVEKELKEGAKTLSSLHKNLSKAVSETLEKISRSEDEISLALKGLFSGAVKHSPAELERARIRKELGYPPGKKGDPLGDQLSWEQFLSHVETKSEIWIVTADGDFIVQHEKSHFLNPVLRRELGDRKVHCFDNVVRGIEAFANATGEGKRQLPSPQVLTDIEREFKLFAKLREVGVMPTLVDYAKRGITPATILDAIKMGWEPPPAVYGNNEGNEEKH